MLDLTLDQVERLPPRALNDFFGNLQSAVSKIQEALDNLSQGEVQKTNNKETSSHVFRLADESVINTSRNADDCGGTTDGWPGAENFIRFRKSCAKHKSECEKMQMELGYLIAHYHIVGGNKDIIEAAKLVQEKLLDPVQHLEGFLTMNPNEMLDSVRVAKNSIFWHLRRVDHFRGILREHDVTYSPKIESWNNCLVFGWNKIDYLLDDDSDAEFAEFLDFMINVFFPELEMEMNDVAEGLAEFEKETASAFLATLKIEDFEKTCNEYMSNVFPSRYQIGDTSVWLEPDRVSHFRNRCAEHRVVCNIMQQELRHLTEHYGIVGGDKEVIKAAEDLQTKLLAPVQLLEKAVLATAYRRREYMENASVSLKKLLYAVNGFQGSLYRHEHAFYFRRVKQWVTCIWKGLHKILAFLRRHMLTECLEYIQSDFFIHLESTMIGMIKSHASGGPRWNRDGSETIVVGSVVDELKAFGETSFPSFLAEEKERDTTRYVNITTIATFFSSVTATTLQFTYAPTDPESVLRGIVNLLWFSSLVFSVSSGVSSLLGMSWRRSSVYHSPRSTPKPIRMWFEKAPMVFLTIAAVTFILGLNLFAYMSLQPQYVSLTTNVFTGVHSSCLLAVTGWFIYQLKYESIWAKWLRMFVNLGKITTERVLKVAVKWFIDLTVKWTRMVLNQPVIHHTYMRSLHLRRNIYWSFSINTRVASLNINILDDDWSHDWPHPYHAFKVMRDVAYLFKKTSLGVKNAVNTLVSSILKHYREPSLNAEEQVSRDVEEGSINMHRAERLSRRTLPRSRDSRQLQAMSLFYNSILEIFGEAKVVDEVVKRIYGWIRCSDDLWDDSWLEGQLKQLLWGYPDLVEKFHGEVKGVLDPLRDTIMKGKQKKEKEEKEKKEKEKKEKQRQEANQHPQGYNIPPSIVSPRTTRLRIPEAVSDCSESICDEPQTIVQSSYLFDGVGPSGTRHLSRDNLGVTTNEDPRAVEYKD